jgi:hypothetical protein
MTEENAGIATAEDDAGSDGKMFSQEDVNRMMAEHKRTLQAENVALKDQVTGLSTQWEEFQSMLQEVAGETGTSTSDNDYSSLEGEDHDDASGDDEVTKRLQWLQKKHQQELDALRSTVEQEKKLRQDAEERRLITERDSALQEALAANDVVSMEGGMKFFRDNLEYDKDGSQWRYRAKDGLTFNIKDGIAEELPDWLKKPSSAKGGSGSQAALINEIDALGNTVKAAQDRAAHSGDPNDIAVYQRAKRELADLQTQQALAQAGVRK